MKIQHLELETAAGPEMKHFYTQKLGLPLVEIRKDALFTVRAGNTCLSFYQEGYFEARPAEGTPTYHFAFNIPQNQLFEAQAWLKQLLIPLCPFQQREVVNFPNWNAHALYFQDPAGNVLELIARHDLDNAQSDAFGPQSLLSISEVGFPVPNLADFYAALQPRMPLPFYSHISNLETFCALGDAEGLLIVVPLQRAWFPTSLRNGIFPLRLTLEGKGSSFQPQTALPYIVAFGEVHSAK
ncbi:MAG: hypothetical protein OHK0053_04430 [Microscillaceae bacterium]